MDDSNSSIDMEAQMEMQSYVGGTVMCVGCDTPYTH